MGAHTPWLHETQGERKFPEASQEQVQAAAVGRGLPESISSVRENGADGVSSSRDRVPGVLGKSTAALTSSEMC